MAPHFRPSGFYPSADDSDEDNEPVMERPSILGYRQTINLRRSYYPQVPTKPAYAATFSMPSTSTAVRQSTTSAFVRSPVYYGRDYATKPAQHQDARKLAVMFGEDEEEKKDDDDDDDADSVDGHSHPHHGRPQSKQSSSDSDDDMAVVMMPIGDMPLLDASDDDEEQEPDVILCDPTRLTHTKIIDEDGYRVDRNSLMRPTFFASTSTTATTSTTDPSMSMTQSTSPVPLSSHSSGSSADYFAPDPIRSQRLGLGASGPNRPDSVLKCGLLFRQGFGFRHGGWKVRYVELTSAAMTFYTEENGRKRHEVSLSSCDASSIEIMPHDSQFDGAQATMWRFAFRAKNRRVLLAAYTEAEMKEWLRCLHVVLHVQQAGAGRFTDLIVPNGTLLAEKEDGLMRMSNSQVRWWHTSSFSRSNVSETA